MSKLAWYWHRLRAMSPGEVALHARKKLRQVFDARQHWDSSGVQLECSGAFPKLPRQEDAPEVLREALRRDVEDILAGRWKAFGHLDLQVEDPPKWHKDYLAGKDLATDESAFKLDYRELPDGADIKLIWELSRWHPLVRLAMAAHVLGDGRAAAKCVDWLEDWVKHNPPYRGWNWTSALEVGMRLVQFTWMDALLSSSSINEAQTPSTETSSTDQSLPASALSMEKRLERLRQQILPPHVWYAWRHKSFGSSANNHLIGELAGLILATVRWPGLAQWGAPLDDLRRRWEREVLAQFAEDGGNKEQALNYHLFSWEFCWQAMHALSSSERTVAPEVYLRLLQAGDFFVKVQHGLESWDYGDSDNAFVIPLFLDQTHAVAEWWNWMVAAPAKSLVIDYWLSEIRHAFQRRLGGAAVEDRIRTAKNSLPRYHSKSGIAANPAEDWFHFPQAGQCIARVGLWNLRWDLSPLGYPATGAHGHLDALHLSIWWKEVALVVDPGTGAYHADKRLRAWLASREAHNGPSPFGVNEPERIGAFLWDGPHHVPHVKRDETSVTGILNLTGVQARRTISHSPVSLVWRVEDACFGKRGENLPFTVRWQFAPGSWVKCLDDRKFSVHRADVAVVIEVDGNWAEVGLIEPVQGSDPGRVTTDLAKSLEGIVSPAFRKTVWAPYLKLTACPQRDKPCVFTTTFLASTS